MKLTKMTLSLLIALALLLSAAMLPSCSAGELYSVGDGEIEVLCTIFPLFDLAREVGGERVTVTLLQDSGADMHSYTPTGKTLKALSSADVFVCIGGVSDEKWLHDAIKASGNEDLKVVYLIDSIEGVHAELECDWSEHDHGDDGHGDEHSHEDEHSHGDGSHEGHDHSSDEHIWLSLRNAETVCRLLEEAFSSVDPDGDIYYSQRTDAYISSLKSLDEEYALALHGLDGKRLVFADRFPFVYLFHDYHIPYIAAFSGCSSEVNASFETQLSLIRAVQDGGLDFVLTCEGGGKALAEAVSVETGCDILALDSMQSINRADIEAGTTYLDVMRKNLEVLKEALS